MHLASAAEFSTFRRTLAAILRPVIGLASENDPQLSEWMSAHLQVATVGVTDAEQLGRIEAAVLDILDPPLNLRGRPPSPLRARLAELRRERNDAGQTSAAQITGQTATQGAPVTDAERLFHQAMVAIYETAKRELGYNATRFLRMVSEQGGVATARQLLRSDQPPDGFTSLWSHHRLDLTVEAHILKPEYQTLFTDADRQQASDRLEASAGPGNSDIRLQSACQKGEPIRTRSHGGGSAQSLL